MGKFERLSWEELQEQMTALAGGPAYHSFSENEVSQLIAQALVRIMERLDNPPPKPRTRSRKSAATAAPE